LILLVGFVPSGGEAGCFKCSGAGQVEVSLDGEAQLVVVCVLSGLLILEMWILNWIWFICLCLTWM